MAEEEHENPYDFRRFTQIGLEEFLRSYGYEVIESGKLNSWKNSMRILKISAVCHNCKNNIISKIYKNIYILIQNVARIIQRNKIESNILFSNKVYCIAKKIR